MVGDGLRNVEFLIGCSLCTKVLDYLVNCSDWLQVIEEKERFLSGCCSGLLLLCAFDRRISMYLRKVLSERNDLLGWVTLRH